MGKLTTAAVRALNAPGRHGDGGGLYLSVSQGRDEIVGPAASGWPASGQTRASEASRQWVCLRRGGWRTPTASPWPLAATRGRLAPTSPRRRPRRYRTFEVVARRFHEVNVAAGGWTNPNQHSLMASSRRALRSSRR